MGLPEEKSAAGRLAHCVKATRRLGSARSKGQGRWSLRGPARQDAQILRRVLEE
ncbi:hypothetical protein HMPREF9057_02520 [Actinomyces sp. oral taxon 171 str. F0337]|nr:hypothetical protein HMPREF9057_02520 [Actinomyces sp. oral taxon 171 str. F0337]